MVDFIQNCLDGVMLGSSYALLAIGFTLIFGVMRRLNLSYGPSIMLGAFVGTLIYLEFQAGGLAVAVATVIGAILVGMYVERLCFWAIRQGAALASRVSSFAIWMQLEEIFQIIRELHRDGTTIFLVEQNAHMALQVADHFYLLEQGRVTFSGTPGQVAEDEVIQRVYLGSGRSD